MTSSFVPRGVRIAARWLSDSTTPCRASTQASAFSASITGHGGDPEASARNRSAMTRSACQRCARNTQRLSPVVSARNSLAASSSARASTRISRGTPRSDSASFRIEAGSMHSRAAIWSRGLEAYSHHFGAPRTRHGAGGAGPRRSTYPRVRRHRPRRSLRNVWKAAFVCARSPRRRYRPAGSTHRQAQRAHPGATVSLGSCFSRVEPPVRAPDLVNAMLWSPCRATCVVAHSSGRRLADGVRAARADVRRIAA